MYYVGPSGDPPTDRTTGCIEGPGPRATPSPRQLLLLSSSDAAPPPPDRVIFSYYAGAAVGAAAAAAAEDYGHDAERVEHDEYDIFTFFRCVFVAPVVKTRKRRACVRAYTPYDGLECVVEDMT